MPNAWLNHVRQLRKNNRNMSYKQLLSHAKNSYGGGNNQMNQQNQNQSRQGGNPTDTPTPSSPPGNSMASAMNMIRSMTQGGGVTGFESRSSLTRSATTLGGRRRSSRNSRKTRRRRR